MNGICKKPISLILISLFSGLPSNLTFSAEPLFAAEFSPHLAVASRWNGENQEIRYQYSDYSRLTEITDEAQFTYDEVGRVITRNVNGELQTLEWNARGQLTKVRYSDETETTYRYDPLGRLIQSTNRQEEITKYVYDGLKLIQERREDGTVLASYIYAEGLDRPVLMTMQDRAYLFIYDRLGSVVAIADTARKNSEAVVARYRYDAWGNLLEETGQIQQPFRFAGYVWEPETELYYLGNRWYDPAIGRFINPDPVLPVSLRPQDWNTYVYASNDPVNRVDAVGLRSKLNISQGYSQWDALGESLTHLPQTLVQSYRQRPKAILESNETTSLGLPQRNTVSWVEAWNSSDTEAVNALLHPLLGSLPENPPGFSRDQGFSLAGFDSLPGQIGNGLVYANQLALPELYGSVWYDAFLKPHASTQTSGAIVHTDSQIKNLFGFTDSLTEIPTIYSKKTFQRPGAIPLGRSAKALSQLTELRGAVWDSTSKQLIITGKRESGPALRLEDLLVAIDTLYFGEEIGVSIDPVPPAADKQLPDYMTVRYIPEQIKGTNIGHVVFEADRWLKVLSMGQDNVTGEATPTIEGYQSRLDRIKLDETQKKETVWNRFWFEPNPLSMATANNAFRYDQKRIKIQTEYFDPGPPPKRILGRDPAANDFVSHINENYGRYSKKVPIFRELEQVMQMVAIGKWLRHESIYPDNTWLSTRPRTSVRDTPETTPAKTLLSDNIFERNGKWFSFGIYGGVTLAPEPILNPDPAIEQYRDNVISSRPSDDVAFWEAPGDETAVAISLATEPEPGGIRWVTPDLTFWDGQGLVRYMDSLNPETIGPFGPGWSAEPSELQFPKPYQKVKDDNSNLQTEVVFHDNSTGTSTAFELVRGADGTPRYKSSEDKADSLLKPQKDGYLVQIGTETHTFDSLGRLQKRTLADGSEEIYVREDFGEDKRLSQIRYSGERTIDFEYDVSGFRIAVARDHTGRTTFYKYDDLDRLQSVQDTQGTPKEIYTYNDDGNADTGSRIWV